MGTRVLILGAGFGGLELSTMLSEALGDDVEVTLIDKSDAFVFGFSKLDVMFGRTTPDAVRLPYRDIAKPGVRFLQETITAIDPEARRVTTDAGVHEADVLVVALGADYDFDATPGLAGGGNEFYSVAGAERLRRDPPDVLARAASWSASAARRSSARPRRASARCCWTTSSPRAGVRDACEISFVIPLATPVPPVARDLRRARGGVRRARHHASSPAVASARSTPARSVAVLDDGTELPFDLFLGVPKHRAPDVVIASGMTEDGYVPVDSATLRTRFPGVYAVGDVATAGVPKAGVFAEGAARVVAQPADRRAARRRAPRPLRRARLLLHRVRRRTRRAGGHRLPLRAPAKTGSFNAPSAALVAEKEHFGSSRRARWFGA